MKLEMFGKFGGLLEEKRHVHDIVDGRLVGQLLDTLVAGRISRMEATGR